MIIINLYIYANAYWNRIFILYIYIFEIIFERKIEHDAYILCIQNIMT